MTWIKLEDKAPRHPKVAGLTDKAFRVWVTSMCYASEFLTDGILPPAYLITVKKAVQDELIAARLWDKDGDVTSIHDYLGHQTSKASVERKKEKTRDRQSRFRNGVTNALVTEPEYREQIQRTDTENRKESGRARHYGDGANEPGSLPRDHMHHSLCGPGFKICLKTWEYNTLAKQLNNPDVHATRAVLSQFVEALEKGVTPNESIGPFSWVEKNFQTYLKSIGKAPAPLISAAPKPRGVAEILAEREAAKGKAS